MKINELKGANLALIGDAYYELKIREYLINKGITSNDKLKKESIKFVSASAHEAIMQSLKDALDEEEQKIFLRGRNNAPSSHNKNVSRTSYIISTGFEAIIGYHYLNNNIARANFLIELAIRIIEGETC